MTVGWAALTAPTSLVGSHSDTSIDGSRIDDWTRSGIGPVSGGNRPLMGERERVPSRCRLGDSVAGRSFFWNSRGDGKEGRE
jgi:hypothetical protein